MKIAGRIMLVLLALSLIFTSACGAKLKKVMSMGEMKDNTYTNSYFGITFTTPDSWIVPTDAEKDILSGMDDVQEGDSGEARDERYTDLVFIMKHPINYLEGYNARFMCSVENLGLESVLIRTGEKYLKVVKDKAEEKYGSKYIGPVMKESVGGRDFYTIEVAAENEVVKLVLKYYCRVTKGYALMFAITYANQEDKNELESIIKSVKFQ
jgi:hypothetical protein